MVVVWTRARVRKYLKDQVVNILGFVSPMVSSKTTLLKIAIDNHTQSVKK